MICANCGANTTHVKITLAGEVCPKCGGFAEASGARTDNAAGSSSFRIRQQQHANEGDMLPAHFYNKETRRIQPNPEFIKRFPDTAKYHYSPDELRKAGMPKMAKKVEDGLKVTKTRNDKDVHFSGSRKKGIAKVLKK